MEIIEADEGKASEVLSIHEKKLIDIENRKKLAINSPVVQDILNKFKGAEIISAN